MKKVMMCKMNGWEFLDMIKKLRWKDTSGTYKHLHRGEAELGDRTKMNYVNYAIKRHSFIGWDYWFDKPFPDEYFDEEIEIYYIHSEGYLSGYVEEFLTKHGFEFVNIKVSEIE